MTCPNCRRPAPANEAWCPTCGADLAAPPPAPRRASALRPRGVIGLLFALASPALEITGVVSANLLVLAAGYFAGSLAWRLGRAELAELSPGLAPGSPAPPAAHAIASGAKWMGLAGMALAIPLAFLAVFRPWVQAIGP